MRAAVRCLLQGGLGWRSTLDGGRAQRGLMLRMICVAGW